MEKQELPSLVTLETKPKLTEKPIVKINFQGLKPKVDEEEGKGDKEFEKSKKHEVKIVNKRKGEEYRKNIFDRLHANKVNTGYVLVATELKSQNPLPVVEEKEEKGEPLKTGKKLVIRNVEFKIPPKKEVIEEEEEKPVKQDEDEAKTDDKSIKDVEDEEKSVEQDEGEGEDDEGEEAGLRKLVKATEKTVEVAEEKTEKAKRGRKPKDKGNGEEKAELPVDLTTAILNNTKVTDRLPKEKEKRVLATSTFYMNNRKIFIQKLSEIFKNYRIDLQKNENSISCENRSQNDNFDLLTHQKVVRDYLSLYTPYRGLLLYHGLGSGKCHKIDTPIMMHNGSIKMVQDIQVGDFLMGDDSKPRTVLSLARGVDKMYEVCPVKGDKYTVNQEHILCLKASGFPKFSRNNHKSKTNYNIQWIENNKFLSKTFTFNKENEVEKQKEANLFFENIKTNPETNNNVYETSIIDYLKLSDKMK